MDADLLVGGKQLARDPISSAVTEAANTQVIQISGLSQAAYGEAVTAFQSMAKLSPGDPQAQIDLANAAQQAGDYATAIAAYERWLKLAPEDSQASIIKQQLKQLRGTAAASSG